MLVVVEPWQEMGKKNPSVYAETRDANGGDDDDVYQGDPAEEVASMTRKLINAGGNTAAVAVSSWARANADAAHAVSLLTIAESYDFVSEEERVVLLNNTVQYYVRDSSKARNLSDRSEEGALGRVSVALFSQPFGLPLVVFFFFFLLVTAGQLILTQFPNHDDVQ